MHTEHQHTSTPPPPTNPDHDPLLQDLTPPQREAATHVQGPLLVLAAAGSGKTRVITRRIAHLILRVGIPPWNVLAITFTNKAAGEMRQRVAQLVSDRQARAVTVCTFHSLCSRLLREFAHILDLPRTYSIYDSNDQLSAMKQALKALNISTSNFPPAKVLHTISQAKNQLLGPQAYAADATDFYSRTVSQIYTKYQAILTTNNALDFDDLLLRSVTLMREHPDVLAHLRDRYQYLLIDEYQDTNHAQFVLANALADQHKNICATGDPDQSIYGWRGANIRNILEFESYYPDAQTVMLEQNYRSTQSILAVADQLIQHNRQRKHKALWTQNEPGQPVQTITCHDEQHEAQWVLQWFRSLNDQQLPWSQMAVFYRVNSLSRVMEDALRTANIPYQIARGTSFYERKEIKDAIAYLRVIANPADEVNLLRIINTPARGISPNTVRAVQAHAVARGQRLFEALQDASHIEALNTRAIASITRFVETLRNWRALVGLTDTATVDTTSDAPTDQPQPTLTQPSDTTRSLRGLVEQVIRESGLESHYRHDKSDPEQERLMNLGELVSSAQQFEQKLTDEIDADPDTITLAAKLEAYMEQISLVSDLDGVASDQGAVTLMTLHAAKGLEFPAVAMIGLEEGLLPHAQANNSNPKLEEERRLCFVGITRAQQHLAMTHTHYRTLFGQVHPAVPSRFFDELPKDHTQPNDVSDQGYDRTHDDRFDAIDEPAPPDDDDDQDALSPGQLVRHPQFGLGRIVAVHPGGSQPRARVEFNTAGVKTLILKYARLEKISL